MTLRITDTSGVRGVGRGRPRTPGAKTPAPGGVDRESRPAEHTVTRCPTCGRLNATVHDCRCGHSVIVHDINRADRRTKCTRDGCGCARYTEETP